jgi:hypothetical protein
VQQEKPVTRSGGLSSPGMIAVFQHRSIFQTRLRRTSGRIEWLSRAANALAEAIERPRLGNYVQGAAATDVGAILTRVS